MSILFHHARKLDAHGQIDDFWMVVDGDTIVATGRGPEVPFASRRVDVGGRWLVPGFIDLHCHGGGGHSFENGTGEISQALETHRQQGTTRSLISLVANPIDVLAASLSVIADLVEADPLVLGAHVEGPFLDQEHRGAHSGQFLRDPQPARVDELIGAARNTMRMLTIAPELPNALETIDVLVEAGVTVAIGHTAATYDLAREAFDRGARVLTHAFNAMEGIRHRAPGPIVAAFDDPRVTLELILDGLHVHPRIASLAFESAPGRVALVTDAMAAAGSSDGDYQLGTLAVSVRDGLAVLRGTDTIAGSTLTLDRALRNAISLAGQSPRDAVASVTHVPARALGIERRYGMLSSGHVADMVILDHDWNVEHVWAAGNPLR